MIGLSHSMLQLAKYLTGDDFSITKPVREPGITSNDRMELNGIIPIKLQVSHLKEASGVMGKLFSSI
jgi:hypothetical protein